MNNYCKHLKKRKNKPYCILLNKEITYSICRDCVNKEYKTKIVKNSSHKSVSAQLGRKTPLKKTKMHNKSKKMRKLERNRRSVFTDDLDHCYLCGRKKDDLHELLGGRNRLNCIKLGYIIPVCRLCHSRIQDDNEFKMYWAKKVQLHYEENIGDRNEFIATFRKNYID